jgi:cytidylate kinase
MAVITISREYGSGGERIGGKVARELGYSYFDKELLSDVARAANMTEEQVGQFDEKGQRGLRNFLKKLFVPSFGRYIELPHYYPAGFPMDASLYTLEGQSPGEHEPLPDADKVIAFFREVIEKLWKRDNVVIIGRGAQNILADQPNTIHIRFVGLIDDRRKTVMQEENLTAEEALKKIEKTDKQRAQHFKRYYDGDWADPKLYHLTLNTSFVTPEQATQLILSLVRAFVRA